MSENVAHRDALVPGTRLREFELLEVLGRGGFGVTYRGWYPNLGIHVAIKEYMPSEFAVREPNGAVYPKTRAIEEWYRWGLDKFLDEAKRLARFNHPNIVRVLQFFEGHGTAYMVMEYLEGQTLYALLQEHGTLGEDRLRALLGPILEGLEQVHAAGYLHRDIKPGNIVFRDDDTPVLIDFGAAHALTAEHSRTVASFEMPGFSPIEQYSVSGQNYGPWTDLYAVGAVLYRAMTERVPVDALSRIEHDDLEPVARVAKGRYSRRLTDAVDWALRLRAAERPQSIDQWRRVLEGRSRPPRASGGASGRFPRSALPRSSRSRCSGSRAGAWWWVEQAPPVSRVDPAPPPGIDRPADPSGNRMPEPAAAPAPNPPPASDPPRERSESGRSEAAQSLSECRQLKSERLWEEAMGCVQRVLETDADNAEAREEARQLDMLVAFWKVYQSPSVEGYFRFIQGYPWSPFVDAAMEKLKERESSYWEEVVAADTPERYRRYLEIYPAGRYESEARRRLSGGG